MTKKEFIERYGEDAWERHKEYCRKYCQKHKEERKEKHKEYMRNYLKQYRAEHKEERAAYLAKNKEKITAQVAEYRKNNNEAIKAKTKEYYNSKHGRACNLKNAYMKKDKDKGFDTSRNITAEWIIKNIFNSQKCVYCGESDWRKLGVDRIDNSKGHVPENCVCSCWDCNNERKNKYSFEEFIKMKKSGT